ncbi:MAG: hypothetical protein JWN22_3496 [Nocardioides sp.]|jgi:hypothetical protein|nr:hypothetical protein [Nocardioides sp.]
MRRRDEGSALIMVLGSMTVLMLFVSVALSYAMRTAHTAAHATGWNQAFSAAEAGVDDYVARLNRDDVYWRTTDCTNLALRAPHAGASPPCGWGSATAVGWLSVPASPGVQFHYDVDVTSTTVDGTIDLTSTGRSGGVTRTIEVTLRRGGFGEFLYSTVYETKDPADYANPVVAMDQCAHYSWEPRTSVSKPRNPDPAVCQDISFGGGDKLNGPIHSNDGILISDDASRHGPWFQGTVTTSMPSCQPVNGVLRPATSCYRASGTVHPRFDKGIAYRSEIEMPESIGDLRQYVTTSARVPHPGCLYTGPTRIVFNPTVGNATPTMKVWSRWSRATLNPGCGDAAGPWPQILDVPQNNLIMVQDVPSSQSTPASGSCTAGSIDASGSLTSPVTGTFPQAGDYNQTLGEANCRYGTALVEGTLKGRLTISADNNIVITGDLTYQGGENGTDALGLVAENSVQVYHPVTSVCTTKNKRTTCVPGGNMNRPSGTTFLNPQIYGSILTLQHSFEVQQYDVGNGLGTLKLFGSLAQRFRGIVKSGSSGYLKDYNYDSRLRYAPPPYFLDPVRSAWGMKTFGEVAPRYGG